uniref:AP-2 complex subunit beta-1, putative n=1 Tax=Arundo donax TaxID=35708 RepID=A0A0A9FYK6_ARUDO
MFAFLRLATKNTFDAARRSMVASMLLTTALGYSFVNSLSSGRDFQASRKLVRSIFPSSPKNTRSKNLSLKYHTGC